MRLVRGNRVVIIGGGPAGSFMALHLSRLSVEAKMDLDIQIFEPRDFSRAGPGGCNKCAGILSSTFVSRLESFGLSIPPDLVQSELHSYVLHIGGDGLPLHQPDPSRRIISIYRGSGPRLSEPPNPRSFDHWLLEQSSLQGARVQRARVLKVLPGNRPTIVTRSETVEADLVVLATGVNSNTPLEPAWGYRPPYTETMAQDEMPLPAGMLDGNVHVFFRHPPGLIFAGLIPKGRYANISLLGKGLPRDAIAQFLEHHNEEDILAGQSLLLCGCTPRVAISPAAGYFADRMVVVGDAAVTRLYKDGIGSAFTTAGAAAQTAVHLGVGQNDFARGYRPVCRSTALDNRYGRMLFRLWDLARNSPLVLSVWRQTLLVESGLPPGERVHTWALWSMFTGDDSYRKIFYRSLFSMPAFRLLWKGALRAWRET